ncbi:AMMECR1 domain-containing protein [Sulfurimonas aquatica]|uniref:AMMECR1 domain-containing protein n=1 Tax=Sulfurimonas aquatica TaxID=2672570 RepID=A0A975AY37_9BACT|nr:AMMECR1 domain-containing protein [Sulfurimonas aquatica]QSZ40726.1 AMMECR1 domain-containing protein [Sulfurimonas aquatica]
MSRSVLLQLARDSIAEVFEAQHTIDKNELITLHPLLAQPVSVVVNLYINNELKGSSSSLDNESTLINNIILCAKKAAFEDPNSEVLTTSQYLHAEVELILQTPDGEISERDPAIIS